MCGFLVSLRGDYPVGVHGLSFQWLLLLWEHGLEGTWASVVAVHGLSCPLGMWTLVPGLARNRTQSLHWVRWIGNHWNIQGVSKRIFWSFSANQKVPSSRNPLDLVIGKWGQSPSSFLSFDHITLKLRVEVLGAEV